MLAIRFQTHGRSGLAPFFVKTKSRGMKTQAWLSHFEAEPLAALAWTLSKPGSGPPPDQVQAPLPATAKMRSVFCQSSHLEWFSNHFG